MRIRQPIISVLGHVDSGKTTLLDAIRRSSVVSKEVGAITQHIGASEIPKESIEKICKPLLKKMNVELKIPGLLFIDTPGHEVFSTLRKRGGAIADIAILVIDALEGFKEQTDESLLFLKEFKTPFIVAMTKIDRIEGYKSTGNTCLLETLNYKNSDAIDKYLYKIVAQLYERGFESERYDRINDFSKQIAIVPVSGVNNDGVADLIVLIAGLSQKFLKKRLIVNEDVGKGTILEVKNVKGMGNVADVILYDGCVRKGDFVVLAGKQIFVRRLRGIFKPRKMKEIRIENIFIPINKVCAASGIRIIVEDVENAVPGFPIRFFRDKNVEKIIIEDVKREVKEVEIESDENGVIVKADTLGSLEAMEKLLTSLNLKIRKADIGSVNRQDILEAKAISKPIFVFNIQLDGKIKKFAIDNGVKIFHSDVIYKLIEEYNEWLKEEKRKREEEIVKKVKFPARMYVLKGCCFRQSKPAIFGVEIMEGTLKKGSIVKTKNRILGEVKDIQVSGNSIEKAKIGEKVAISIDNVVFGRHVREDDVIEVLLTDNDIKLLEKVKNKMRLDELELLEEYKKRKKK